MTLRAQMVAAGLCVVIALAATLGYRHNPLTNRAAAYAQDIAVASAATYVTLRTLNAALSTAQEIEVSGGAVVVSGTARPLKLLEPIDDTIERIAGVVFALMVMTGLLAFALGPVGAIGAAMIGLAAMAWLLTRLGARLSGVPPLARQLGGYGVFFFLALPLAFVLSALVSDLLTTEAYARHQAIIAEITAHVETAPQAEEAGWWTGLRDSVGELDRYKDIAANIWTRADDLIASYLSILAVFMFRVFLLPALFAGALLVALRSVGRRSAGA